MSATLPVYPWRLAPAGLAASSARWAAARRPAGRRGAPAPPPTRPSPAGRLPLPHRPGQAGPAHDAGPVPGAGRRTAGPADLPAVPAGPRLLHPHLSRRLRELRLRRDRHVKKIQVAAVAVASAVTYSVTAQLMGTDLSFAVVFACSTAVFTAVLNAGLHLAKRALDLVVPLPPLHLRRADPARECGRDPPLAGDHRRSPPPPRRLPGLTTSSRRPWPSPARCPHSGWWAGGVPRPPGRSSDPKEPL